MNNTHALNRGITLLQISCYALLVFVVIWWLAVLPGYDRSAQIFLDISVWPIDGSHDQLSRDARFLSGIGAGLLAALALLILLVVIPELKRSNFTVIRGTTVAILTWYVVDSAGCILVGVASNAIFNAVYAAIILVPLWLIARAGNAYT